MPSYTVGNKELSYTEKDLLVANLKFYPKNPRVFSLLNEDECEPDQDTIYNHMKSTEHVRTLRLNIRTNGGLINPILVSGDVVIEGNSRLAAYKMLQETDPVRWGKIRCHVFKEPLTDDDVFNLLCTFHVNGRKDWNPMEQAGLLYRRQQECMRPIEEIAKERGMKAADAKNMVATYELMKENDDIETSKWSYYEEFRKIIKYVQQAEFKVPDVSIKTSILEKIKDGTIAESKDLRKIGKLVRSDEDEAIRVLNAYVNGECDIEDIEDIVANTDKLSNAIKQSTKFHQFLTNHDISELLAMNDTEGEELDYNLRRIYKLLNKRYGD
jgi:hypothetical protein